MRWLEKADFEAKIVIAGNHDITLDSYFYNEHGSYFHNQSPQSSDKCLRLLRTSPNITYLSHSSATVELTRHPVLKTSFTVFGSPYSPRSGLWAFGYSKTAPEEAADDEVEDAKGSLSTAKLPVASELWSGIPLDSDIVITHTPPHTHCDEAVSKRRAMGCEELRRALWRVRPKLTICGHVHEGRGAERVRWDVLGTSGAPYAELGVERWEDPGAPQGSHKLSLVDLTARGGKRPLENDGSPPRRDWPADQRAQNHVCEHFEDSTATALSGFGTRGVGGNPEMTARCDTRALCCRLGRRETCVVNCAIAATNWPHAGGKRFHKPIVVDLDLPVIEN